MASRTSPSEPAIGAGRDRRERSIRVTEAGREVLEQALPLWEGAQSRLYSALGPVAFVSLLDRLDNVIDRAAA